MNTDDLIQRQLDGLNTPAEAAQLSLLLETDAEVRNRYLDLAGIHAALAADESLRTPRPIRTEPRPSGWGMAAMAKLAAVLVFAAVAAWMLFPSRKPAPAENAVLIARLVSTENAEWADSATGLSLNSGDEPAGRLELVAGSAEFATAHGATVQLEAPAVVRFESANSIFVDSGRVVCRCPTPESRLTVRTAQTQVVDLGTEFTVEARKNDRTRVAVLSGEVQIGPDSTTRTVLRQGQAADVLTRGVTLLEADEVRKLMQSFDDGTPTPAGGKNRLINAGFEWEAGPEWSLTPGHALSSEGAVRISSLGCRFWPSARQTILLADLPGRAVAASVRARQPREDPLQPQQFAVLKLVFVDAEHRELAYISRHFLFAGEPVDEFQTAHAAAVAPPGAKGVRLEMLLNARGEPRGSVDFDDAVLMIGEPAK